MRARMSRCGALARRHLNYARRSSSRAAASSAAAYASSSSALGRKSKSRGWISAPTSRCVADWTIVGTFESGGDAHESELMADGETVLSAYRRNLYQSVIVQLQSEQDFDAFKQALTTNPQLSVDVKRERDY